MIKKFYIDLRPGWQDRPGEGVFVTSAPNPWELSPGDRRLVIEVDLPEFGGSLNITDKCIANVKEVTA